MSLEDLMQQAAGLDDESQRKLIGYLVSLRMERSSDHRVEMARRIDDSNPHNWLTLDELDAKLNALPS